MSTPDDIRTQLTDAYNRRDWARTYRLAEQLLSFHPDMIEAYYAAGVAALEMRQIAPALAHLERAAKMEPTRAGFGAQFARALHTAKLEEQALAEADRVRPLADNDSSLLDMLGGIYAEAGAADKALGAYQRAIELVPGHPGYRYNLANALIALGHSEQAEHEIEACLTAEPRFWRAHLALSNLRKQTQEDNHVERMEGALAEHRHEPMANICLNMALAKEHEDLGHYAQSFAHLVEGKTAARQGLNYERQQDQVVFSALEKAFPRPLGANKKGDPSREPIFVFGMPRTGTTLVERILSSHPDVTMTGELLNFGMALRRGWGQRPSIWQDPDIAQHVAELDWSQIGSQYVQSTRPRTGQTARFVDKFPFNFLHAGFIAQALPNARMICLRRHPMDACLGNYRQLFAEKLPYYNYSFDLLDIGHYYIQFDRLMAHWQTVLPDRILQVQYESLVDDAESVTRRILQFCDLPWNDACLRFQDNPSPVTTASALQVRQPIYRSAVGHWKHFESELKALQRLLADAGIRVD
ncbi:tetratricopeptide repeat-containing sulfotransferase family protein [Dyella sp.]|uniref:tetratricopeptide repeat-containing sulfotransferase family protein n=1 Tax=Dyella sp. TaxID=1869338 RepID=UPI002ED158C9